MSRGRAWTAVEDAKIREIAGSDPGYLKRVRDLASEINRSYEAVRRRAERIGARRYPAEPARNPALLIPAADSLDPGPSTSPRGPAPELWVQEEVSLGSPQPKPAIFDLSDFDTLT